MANSINSAALSDNVLNSYYQSFLKELPMETVEYTPISMEAQTVDSISDQVSKYLRNYYDKAINTRKASTVQNNAALDVDATSRGMSSSTWLTDQKNRLYQSEAADVSGLEGDYAANLAQNVYEQYNNYLSNRLAVDTQNVSNKKEVDMFNAQVRSALEELAYSRAIDEYGRYRANLANVGGGRSGNGGGDNTSVETVQDNRAIATANKDILLAANVLRGITYDTDASHRKRFTGYSDI